MDGWMDEYIFAGAAHAHTLYRIIIITTTTYKKTTQFAKSHMKMCVLLAAAYVCIKCTGLQVYIL